jgi:hypothetical protein
MVIFINERPMKLSLEDLIRVGEELVAREGASRC